MENNGELIRLMQRYREGIATEVEARQLLTYIQSGLDTDIIESLIADGLLDKPPVQLQQSPDVQQKLANIFEHMLPEPTIEATLISTGMHRFRRWLPLAAAILLVISVGLWRYASVHSGNGLHMEASDIQPGGNRAILTLTDGRKVSLSTDKNGIVIGDNITYNDGSSLAIGESVISVNDGPPFLTLTTPRGGQYQTTLADGTRIWLNASSTLKYPVRFSGKHREVVLEGEAFFDVAHNDRQPFRVSVGGGHVEVLGTQFNVSTYADVIATLIEGAVKVSNETEEQLLKPGQEARFAGQIQVYEVDTEKTVAWKNGFFYFKDDKISDILQQLSRWYDVEIEYKNPEDMPKVGYNGTIRRSVNLLEVLELINYTGGINFEISDKKVIVSF